LLHLQCELPAALQPVLVQWWEDFHYAELLSLPGFLWARRGHLIAPGATSPIVTMYGLADAAAADQPRPPEFTLLPAELDGHVTFHRRIMRRVSGASEPAASRFVQLLRPLADDNATDLAEAADWVRDWPGVHTVSCWRSVVNTPHTSRAEVVHLTGAELIHAELDADDAAVRALMTLCSDQLPGWKPTGYRQTYPRRADQPV
jgi:hypothetical protein